MIRSSPLMRLCPMIFWVIVMASCTTKPLAQRKQQQLREKIIVVTGSTSGLGRGIATQAAAYGARVIIVARSQQACEQVAEELRSKGGKAMAIAADVTEVEQMEQLVKTVVDSFGRIDVWVNNAGVAAIGAFGETPLNDHFRVIDVNLKGLLHGTYLAINQFKKQGFGTVINIGSVESEIPTAYQVAYSASKAGVRAIGLTIRQELRLAKQKNIHIVTISPWALDTPLWGHTATYTGHQPRMIMMDPPEKAVNAVMHAIVKPKREIPVGIKAHLSYGAHRILPALTERLGSNIAHKYQAEITPPQQENSGNLYKGEEDALPIEGGFKEKMREEKQQR